MILAVVVLMDMASSQRVAKSMHVNKNLDPPFANGKRPTRSMSPCSKGIVTISLSYISFCLELLLSTL